MECAQIWLETGGEDGFLDALVQLKQMRMAGADTDPDDLRPAFARESSKTGERQEERFPGNRAQLFRQALLSFARNISEEAKRQMHLLRLEPTYAAQTRIQFGETLPNRFGKLDGNEESFRAHRIGSYRRDVLLHVRVVG